MLLAGMSQRKNYCEPNWPEPGTAHYLLTRAIRVPATCLRDLFAKSGTGTPYG